MGPGLCDVVVEGCEVRDRVGRRFGRNLVDGCGVPDAVSFGALVQMVSDRRGTTIRFVETSSLDGERVCGAWTGRDGIDTIHLPRAARPAVKLFIACHELGHMLVEPPGAETRLADSAEVRAFLASVLNVERITPYAFRGAGPSADRREAEAEAVGDQLALRVLRDQRSGRRRDFRFEQVFAA